MAFSDNKYTIGAIVLAVVALVGFGISEIAIHSKGTAYSSSDCPSFPANLTSWTATKQYLSQWNWEYQFDQFDGYIYQKCPTLTHDAKVKLGGALTAVSDGKVFSVLSENYIRDCKGNVLFLCRTGDVFETLINKNKIQVSFELRDSAGATTLAYVAGTHFFSDTIELLDATDANPGTPVATLSRKILAIPWKWEFTIHQPNHPASDPRLLSLMAGKKAFSDSDDSTDVCNQYFWGVAYLFLAIAIIIFLGLCFVVYYFFTEIREWFREKGSCC